MLGKMGGHEDGVAEAADVVDEAILVGAERIEHAAVGDAGHVLRRHAAVLRDALDHDRIDALGMLDPAGALLGRHFRERAGRVGPAIRLDTEPQLLEQLLSDVRAHDGDANRARQRPAARKDDRGRRAEVVAAGGGDVGKGRDHGLVAPRVVDGLPNGFGGHDLAAGAVDAEHDGTDARIPRRFLEGLDDLVRVEAVAGRARDGTVDIDDAHQRRRRPPRAAMGQPRRPPGRNADAGDGPAERVDLETVAALRAARAAHGTHVPHQ
ncbi:hypothetical protein CAUPRSCDRAFT_12842 [Caulochytrium protostelioides]|uniref:Uncharacterized protein n=1 Tax=Caulochytrium protostelioides TaxID=1555241 RepID=A0A4V1IT13_9FUNG|nr:hypothetical protein CAUPRSCDRAFT_12842 [Caulochytrium protostelioides]